MINIISKNIKGNMETRWYAIYTKSRAEKKTADELAKKGFEIYLPLQKILRQWSDRKKTVELPLIPSYLFIKMNFRRYFDVLNTKGVVKFISFSGKPIPVPEWQIKNIRILIDSGEKIEFSKEDFIIGDNVYIESGSLKGLKGILVEHRSKKKVLIHIDSIEPNIFVNIPAALLKREKVEKAI